MDSQYPPWPDLLRWLNVVKDRVETIVAIGAEQIVTGELDPDLIPPIPWDRVLKAGSSLGDLETTSATDLTSGTLPDARMPALTGDVSSVAGAVATTLATVNLSPGSYGSGASIPVINVNGKGLVTSVIEQPISTGALTKVDDTNITLTLGGTPATALLKAVSLTLGWSGTLALARGGTAADLSATGGSGRYLKQASVGAAVTVANITAAEITSGAALTKTDDTNVTLALGGSPTVALLAATSLTLGWAGTLAVTRGGTGTGTAFTAGSVLFAGASGVYSQDNGNLFWDDSANRLGIGNAAPVCTLDVTGVFGLNPGTFFSAVDGNAIHVVRGSGTTNAWYYMDPDSQVFLGSNAAATALSTAKNSLVLLWRGQRWTGAASSSVAAQASMVPSATIDSSFLAFGFSDNDGRMLNLTHGTKMGMGITAPTARFHIMAGTATANTSPLKFTSGTNLTTAEAGAVEYDGTNLFFTRAGTVRENVLVAIDNVAAPGTSIGVGIVNFYGSAATNFLGDPNRWLSVNVLGSTYKVPLYT
jgi:hypothetical protein